MEHGAFMVLVAAHIASGVTGAVSFWIPMIGKKGGALHRKAGRIFTIAMLLTGTFASLMSVLTLISPMTTHPHLIGQFDADFVRGIFGWLMLHLGILTVNLAWYGWLCAIHRNDRAPLRDWRNLSLQAALMIAALNCAWQGWRIEQPLMIGMSVVGVATVMTNMWFLYKTEPRVLDWQKEHLKALVGAGISVYTAFMAFGSVRLLPQLALNPIMWSLPVVAGVSTILWHWRSLDLRMRKLRA
jgi:hypothetical protein